MAKRKPAKRRTRSSGGGGSSSKPSCRHEDETSLLLVLLMHAAWQVPVLGLPFFVLTGEAATFAFVVGLVVLVLFDTVCNASWSELWGLSVSAAEAIPTIISGMQQSYSDWLDSRREADERAAREEQRQRLEEERWRAWQEREERKLEEGRARIRAGVAGHFYVACTSEHLWTLQLPEGVRLSEREWQQAVAAAAEACRWRELRSATAFQAAVIEEMWKRAKPSAKNASGRAWQQQQQQEWEQQRRQQQQPKQRSPQEQQRLAALQRQWAEASAHPPDLENLSDKGLRQFLAQASGSDCSSQEQSAAATATTTTSSSSSTDRLTLLQQARRSLQLWECRRLMKCSALVEGQQQAGGAGSARLRAALCAFRISAGSEPWEAVSAARAVPAADLKRTYTRLALHVHPDKTHTEHQELTHLYEDATKFLNASYELLGSHSEA